MDFVVDKGSNYKFCGGTDKDMAVDYEETVLHLFEILWSPVLHLP